MKIGDREGRHSDDLQQDACIAPLLIGFPYRTMSFVEEGWVLWQTNIDPAEWMVTRNWG